MTMVKDLQRANRSRQTFAFVARTATTSVYGGMVAGTAVAHRLRYAELVAPVELTE